MTAHTIMGLMALPAEGHGGRLSVVVMIIGCSPSMHQPQHMGALRQIQSHTLIARAMHTAIKQHRR